MFSIDGIVSGLNTTSIINSLISAQQTQINRLNSQKAVINQKQTSFKAIESSLLTLRSSMSRLNRISNTVFDSRSATSSDDSILTAAASSGASTGTFNLRVNALATAHQIGSNGFESLSSSVTHGSLSIQVGDRQPVELTIDSSNDTLTGLVNEINNQSQDVKATTILDQSTGQYRILLTAKSTGTDNEITLTNNLAASDANATQPDFSGPAIQAAANASVTIGSGVGALTAEYQSNRVDGLISGVTLDLASADATKNVTVTIGQDDDAVTEAIQGFVEDFNSVMDLISEQTKYVSETQSAGPLLGNRTAIDIQDRMRRYVVNNVAGLDGNLNRLSRIGISVTDNGKLSFDSSKLQNVLSGGIDGVDSSDVKRLFGMTATSTSAGVEFLIGSTRTVASTTPYQVDISQAAEQANILSTNALAAQIDIDENNNQFQLKLDGRTSETLTLASGSYTREELASHLQSVINSSTDLGNRSVIVSIDGDHLSIESESYGRNSELAEFSGSALSALGLDGTENDLGVDVVGRFIVNGEIEEATGNGRLLVGSSSNANTADLQVRVSLRADQITVGTEAELSVTRGVTADLDVYLSQLLDPSKGTFQTNNQGFDDQLSAFDLRIERVNQITEAKRTSLIAQFAALEQAMAGLQQTSNFLGGQLSSLSNLSNNS